MPALEVRYEDDSANPIATQTALHLKATGLDPWDADPTQDDPSHVVEDRYYIKASIGSEELLRSHVFAPSAEGDAYWDDVILPQVGTYAVKVMKIGAESDSEAATASITADAP